jgi:hypothetical protein
MLVDVLMHDASGLFTLFDADAASRRTCHQEHSAALLMSPDHAAARSRFMHMWPERKATSQRSSVSSIPSQEKSQRPSRGGYTVTDDSSQNSTQFDEWMMVVRVYKPYGMMYLILIVIHLMPCGSRKVPLDHDSCRVDHESCNWIMILAMWIIIVAFL